MLRVIVLENYVGIIVNNVLRTITYTSAELVGKENLICVS